VTLRWRIALILAVVALVVGAFAAIASYVRTESQLRSSIDDTLKSAAAAVNVPGPDQGGRGRGDRDGFGPGGGQGCPAAGAFQTASAAQLVSTSNAVTPCIAGGPELPVNDDDRTLHPGEVELRTIDIDGQSYRLLSTPWHDGGTLQIARSLAESFSTMVGAVAHSQDQQRRLVSDASHEMRTPLTSLRSNVELLRQIELLPPDERREVIGDVLDDVDELAVLLGELVELASDLAAAEPEESVRLGDLARAVAARTQRRTEREVTVDDSAAVEVVGRPRQLERAISNLVDNGVKYSEPATPIDIVVSGTRVTVGDRGRGISDDDVERIFDRFYRAVDVRTQPGSGLGLSIVDEIVRSHGGSVFARNRDGGGAEVGFTLPGPMPR